MSASAQHRSRRSQSGAQPQQQQGGGESSSMTFTAEEAATPEAQPAGGEAAAQAATTGGDTASLQVTVPGGDVQAQRHPLNEEIYALQRIYALRARRFELNPHANFSLNDPFVQHTGFGLTANYWISNVLAVGVTGIFFQGLNATSDVNYSVGRSTQLVVPINEYQLAASLNFSYVPLYGKFSMFSRFIFHWDMYLTAGVGIMRTRPIAAVDPEVRTFDWGTRILFNAGLGVRVFVNRWLGITGELRNYIYPELLENTTISSVEVGANGRTDCNECRRNPARWTDETRVTDNVMLSVGLTMFLPFSFDYRLPK
ncbi:MAG: outer membrane beta-barrel domain-containing protein [Myxococcales bacterium]|nr:outer membrane beta-barrel domain-containing protein [Myxococcales bacterium]